MTSRRRAALAFLLFGPLLGVLLPDTTEPDVNAGPWLEDDTSCRVCHPGPTRGLRRTVHAFLLEGENAKTSCTVCHGALAEHGASHVDPERPAIEAPEVEAAACAVCHAGKGLQPARAVHPWRRPAPVPRAEVLPGLESRLAASPSGFLGMEWKGLATLGYRILHRNGSRNRFNTDLNLDPGLRLAAIELEGTASAKSPLADLFRVSAHDIDDPYQGVKGILEKKGLYRAEAGFTKTAVTYRASGDFHRVDRGSDETTFSGSFHLDEDLEVFADFSRFLQNGFWLTNRIGNRNVTPLTTIDNVQSPRHYEADTTEAGISGTLLDTQFSVSLEYRDERNRDRWFFTRPSPLNPSVTESEDFSSNGSLRGPGTRFSLSRDLGGLTLDVKGRYLNLDRRITGKGKKRGFDIAEFTTNTDAKATGGSSTFLLDSSVSMELSDDATLLLDSRYLDHDESLDLFQSDVTVVPSLNTTTVVTTNNRQRTSQRVFEGSVQVDLRPWSFLDLSAGYGFSRESLRVPDLESGDADFRSGLIRSDGIMLGATWKPDAYWSLETHFRDFGQNGPQLHDVVEDNTRMVEAKLRHRREHWQTELFAKHKRSENDVSRTRSEVETIGLSGLWNKDDTFDLHATWVYSKVDSRTLTNFFFDPDPNPVPTIVGFKGETHSFVFGLGLQPSDGVHWRVDGTYTTTNGSFDIDLLDWSTDLSVRVLSNADAGVTVRNIDYHEEGGVDDYAAVLAFVYFRVSFGRR